MEQENSTYNIRYQDLPEDIAIFPLPGALLLPGGQLPLHIFEPRYRAMVNDAMNSHRLIGMIQPRNFDLGGDDETVVHVEPSLYDVGCAGKITSFEEMEDGRFLLTLSGIARFKINEEIHPVSGYRRIQPDWSEYSHDFDDHDLSAFNRDKLKTLLSKYFDKEGLSCDGTLIDQATDEKVVTCLSMICPLQVTEKQALLEAKTLQDRADLFMTILEMAVFGHSSDDHATH